VSTRTETLYTAAFSLGNLLLMQQIGTYIDVICFTTGISAADWKCITKAEAEEAINCGCSAFKFACERCDVQSPLRQSLPYQSGIYGWAFFAQRARPIFLCTPPMQCSRICSAGTPKLKVHSSCAFVLSVPGHTCLPGRRSYTSSLGASQ
jgi:hypothetical protein